MLSVEKRIRIGTERSYKLILELAISSKLKLFLKMSCLIFPAMSTPFPYNSTALGNFSSQSFTSTSMLFLK